MKLKYFVLFLLLVLVVFGAVDPNTPVTLTFVGIRAAFDRSNTLVSCRVACGFATEAALKEENNFTLLPGAMWDGTDKSKFITIDNVTLTYEQVLRAIALMAKTEKDAKPAGVGLAWDTSPDADVIEYRVQELDGEGKWVTIQNGLRQPVTVVDGNVPGRTFAVTAVTSAGESQRSNEVTTK